MGKSKKGGQFERDICRRLSEWFTFGNRDDIFWRTAGSGAMAKSRSKRGSSTFGQAGDVQATDPVGQPFLDVFTIELKRGYSKNSIHDVLDRTDSMAYQWFEKVVDRTIQDAAINGTQYWIIITKRDRRAPMLWVPKAAYARGVCLPNKPTTEAHKPITTRRPSATLQTDMLKPIYGWQLEEWLKSTDPRQFGGGADA